jgi:type II secretory pathway pseudopilin PulG
LLAFPLGTVVAILILFYMYKPGIKMLFSGKRVDEYTNGELQQIADVARSSTSSAVLIAAVVGVAVLILVGIIAAIAVPGLMRARASGNETAAIGSLLAINSAQAVFAINCSGGYAVTLEDLASPLTAGSPALLSPNLPRNGVVKSGYSVTLVRGGGPDVTDVEPDSSTCGATRHRPASAYFASAEPVTPGTTGSRYFATDARGVVYASEHPIANPIVESATVAPVR